MDGTSDNKKPQIVVKKMSSLGGQTLKKSFNRNKFCSSFYPPPLFHFRKSNVPIPSPTKKFEFQLKRYDFINHLNLDALTEKLFTQSFMRKFTQKMTKLTYGQAWKKTTPHLNRKGLSNLDRFEDTE